MILATQLIAAKLNIANGSDRSPVASVVLSSDELLAQCPGSLPLNVNPITSAGVNMAARALILDAYNNGLLTGSCTQ
jgi:hypothetical protein